MIKIISGTEAIPVEHPVFLIFGQPGIGKSTLGYSMGDVLCLDFDLGAHRAANRRDTVQINAWTDVAELLSNRDVLARYKSLCVDTVGRCLDALTADIAENDPKKAPGGNLSQQGWGVLKNRFRQFVAQARGLGKDLLLIAHDKEDKDGDVRVVRPDITGGSYGEVLKNADFLGYYFLSGKDRVLDFSPTDRWVGKNPASWSPFKVPATGKCTTFMGDLYAKGRDALGAISGESAKVLAVVEEWRERIAALTEPDTCTTMVDTIADAKLPAIVETQVKKLLADRAKGLGLAYDKGAKAFTATAAAA